jgi:hypothetical protein
MQQLVKSGTIRTLNDSPSNTRNEIKMRCATDRSDFILIGNDRVFKREFTLLIALDTLSILWQPLTSN